MKKIATVLFALSVGCLAASSRVAAQVVKGFFHAMEISAAGGATVVRDNGFGERLFKGSGGLITYEVSPREYYSVGIGLSHRLSDKSDLTLAVSVEQLGFITRTKAIGDEDVFSDKGIDQNRYVVGQVRLNQIIYRRWGLSATVGYASFLNSKRTYFSLRNDSITGSSVVFTRDSQHFSNFDINFTLGITYSVPLADRHQLKIFLQARHGVNDILKANDLAIRALIPSLGVSYQRKLKKRI